ncbi:MAG: nodulation protein NfeD [Bacteroidia bacterium]|nr:nodulation protein NfeD [Bacteroidia bacterium]
MNKILIILSIVISSLLASGNLYSNNQARALYFTIDLKKNVGSTTWIYIQKGFEEARKANANTIVIEMNTYGGEVSYADSIRTKILNSDIPVIVFIDNNAASAGALISIACDKIYMSQAATIGAASVVDQTGQKLPDKYQSYMRATMRATAEAHGKDTVVTGNDTVVKWKRDPLIAEAMVDERTVVPNVADSGKILTFTTQEALKYGYCDGTAENIREIIKKESGNQPYEIVKFKPTAWDNIKGFLMSPIFQGILIMLIIGGIYFELQSPGIGFALGVAITAAVLYFAPLYIDGLAANWEIILFVVGLILIGLEIFVVPGFGITGISGIFLVVSGLILSLLNNVNFDFKPIHPADSSKAILTVIGGLTLGFGLIIYLSNKIGSKGLFKKLALETTLENKEGYIGVPTEGVNIVGKKGIAYTVLRPSGKVKVDEKVYDAVSVNGVFIEKGTQIIVVRYETGQVYVESAE